MITLAEILVKIQPFEKLIWTAIWVIVTIISVKVVNKILFKTIKDNKVYHQVKNATNYPIFGILFIIVISLWLESTDNLATYIGLVSAGVAIALKELFSNMAGWLFIIFRKPFKAGERILINGQKGDVIDIRIFQFSLMEVSSEEEGEQSTGRIIDVPNYFVLMYPLVNYTKGFDYIWHEINVVLTFESDWRLAKELLNKVLNKEEFYDITEVDGQIKNAAKQYMIHYKNLTPIIYTDVKDSGVQLTLRYLCAPKQKRTTVNTIWEEVLHIIDDNPSIELAYPTRRVVN